jgi:hypothetical protein
MMIFNIDLQSNILIALVCPSIRDVTVLAVFFVAELFFFFHPFLTGGSAF